MRKLHRLHLLCLLDLRSSPTELSTSVLFALSKPVHPHQKHILVSYVSVCYEHTECAFGGDEGSRTPVQNTFLVASYNHITSI
jgi:hypothetical protein